MPRLLLLWNREWGTRVSQDPSLLVILKHKNVNLKRGGERKKMGDSNGQLPKSTEIFKQRCFGEGQWPWSLASYMAGNVISQDSMFQGDSNQSSSQALVWKMRKTARVYTAGCVHVKRVWMCVGCVLCVLYRGVHPVNEVWCLFFL